MANKRQRKKQQTKKNIKALHSVGITDKRTLKKYRNQPDKVKKIVKKEERNIEASKRSDIIRSLGYRVSDHSSKRYWGQKRWEEWLQKEQDKIEREKRRRQRQKENEEALYLLIFWKEKTDAYEDSQDLIERFKHEYRHMRQEYILEAIKAFLRVQKAPAEIGTSLVVTAKGKNLQQTKRFYFNFDSGMLADWNEWGLVYEGKAIRYKELLISIITVIRLLYDHSEKSDFINNLFKQLQYVNPKTGRRLERDLGWRGF